VAIINTTPDIVEMLKSAIEPAGIVVVSALTREIREGVVDVEQFVRQHGPKAVLYDIAPPYAENWQFFQHVSNMPAMKDLQFVLTSTNAKHVQDLAGRHQQIYEIVGKPYDLDQVVQATREAVRARPTR